VLTTGVVLLEVPELLGAGVVVVSDGVVDEDVVGKAVVDVVAPHTGPIT